MRKIRIHHKDGDNTAITIIWILNKYLKLNRSFWNSDDVGLNRFYKGLLTRCIHTTDKIVEKYKRDKHYCINLNCENDLEAILKDVANIFEYKNIDYDRDYPILQTMMYIMILYDVLEKAKKKILGVTLKSMISDFKIQFKPMYDFWIEEVDDNINYLKGLYD